MPRFWWLTYRGAGCLVGVIQDATGRSFAWFHFLDDVTVAPPAAVLLKERAKRRAMSFAGPLLDKADQD